MTSAPAKKLGQLIGETIENVARDRFKTIADTHDLYLDSRGKRPGVRNGTSVQWEDSVGKNRKVTLALESGGSRSKKGKPVVFVRTHWLRYGKHAGEKAAKLIVDMSALSRHYRRHKPVLVAVLAGEWTDSALADIRANGIIPVVIPAETVFAAFADWKVDITGSDITDEEAWNRAVNRFGGVSNASRRTLEERISDDVKHLFTAADTAVAARLAN